MDTDHEQDALEGHLGTVTDEEWLKAHLQLSGHLPPAELACVLDPNLPGSALIGDDEVEEAPRG